VSVRVPGWCTSPSLALNGSPAALDDVRERGYARLTRRWARGDRVTLELPMPAVRVWADVNVPEAAGRVAMQRGPVVYCLEGVDHDVPVHTLALPGDAELRTEPNALSGLAALTAEGVAVVNPDGDEALYRFDPPGRRDAALRAVPYFSWANRGQSDMTVWVREDGVR